MKKRVKNVWDTQFEQLQAFKNAHGHTNVPQQSGPLGTWVSKQRTKCRRIVEGKASPLIDERLAKLNGINFEFKLPTKTQKTIYVSWDVRFQELKEFIKDNGHADVPKKFGMLGLWVYNQRKQFRLSNARKRSSLSNERLAKLNGINFEFNPLSQPPSWDMRFQELKEFMKVNGHTNVSQNSGALGIWVSNQRVKFRLSREGKASSLMDEQLTKLNGIQFEFQLKKFTPWNTRFQELKEFKEAHGHTRVNKRSGQLGLWVSSQRTQFRLFQEGKASTMSDQRLAELNGIDFEFIYYSRP
jgi:hypothetical protein